MRIVLNLIESIQLRTNRHNRRMFDPMTSLEAAARRSVLPLLFMLVILFLVPRPGAGFGFETPDPERVRVMGTVLTAGTGIPLPGVDVSVEGTRHRTSTDSRGRFSLTGLSDEAEEVSITFTRMGFEPLIERVRVGDGSTVRLEVAMTTRAVALDPVSVLLERTRMIGDPMNPLGIPGSAFQLNRADLDAQKLAFNNVHEILRQVPGVNIQDEEGYGLRPNIGLRGAGAERSSKVTLMEDGVLIAPAPYSAPAAYYMPNVGRMDGVEVRKGASQIRYGPQTLGGAINFLSSPIPERSSWLLDLSGGEDRLVKTRARVGDASPRMGWLLEGQLLRTDGFKELQGGGGTGFDTRDFLAKLRFNSEGAGPGYQSLEFKFGVYEQTGDETYLGLTDAEFRQNPVFRYAGSQVDVINADHRQLQARYFRQMGVGTDLVVTAYRNDFARNWYKLQSVLGRSLFPVLADPGSHGTELSVLRGADSADDALVVRANNREYFGQGVEAQFGARFRTGALRHDLVTGVRYHEDAEDRLQWEDGYRMASGTMVLTSEGAPGSQANRVGDARAVALFVQDEIRAGRWALVPGLRYETVDFTRRDWAGTDPGRTGEAAVRENSVDALIPGLSVGYEVSPWTHFFAGVHRGFGPPGPGADEETRVEESLNWEAGVRVRRAGIGANLTGFFSDYSNILGRATLATGESGSGELFNGGRVEVFGVEAAVDAELSRYVSFPFRIPVRVAYTFSRGTFLSSFQSEFGPWGEVAEGDRLPYMPEHLFSGLLGVEDAAWKLGLSWNGAGATRTEAGRGAIPVGTGADRFVVFNLSGEVAVGSRAVVYGAVQNLTDRAYVVSRRPAGARPGLPRTLFLGMRISG
jgi:Fe(3+) dicitrate transport protein